MKLPALQFYPGDWRKDPGVQSLNYFDRGVWFEILCLMHESSDRGKLLLNGAPMPDDALATILGLDKQILTTTLNTLLTYGVASRDEESGALINRRMVSDEKLRQIRTEAGKKGGNPVLVKQSRTKAQPKNEANDNHSPKQKSTPSSSSSISTSSSEEEKELSAHSRLMDFLSLKIGHIPNGAKEGKAIKWLLSHGYDPVQCEQCWESLAAETWRTSAVTWTTVQGQIGTWVTRRNSNGTNAENRPNGYQTNAERRDADFRGYESVVSELRSRSSGTTNETVRRKSLPS